MTHIDEGTIHAWLDRQLDEAQARDVESHVAGCAQCSAAVAEARGLIAGSSRVLMALDDVPGGVVPASAKRTMPSVPKRKWQAARWVTSVSAIAAALIIAVVLRQSPAPEVATPADRDSRRLTPIAAAPTAGEQSAGPAAPAPARAPRASDLASAETRQAAHADTRLEAARIAGAQRNRDELSTAQRAPSGGLSASASGAGVVGAVAGSMNQARAVAPVSPEAPPAMADAATPAFAEEKKALAPVASAVGCYAVSSAQRRDLEPGVTRSATAAPLATQKASRAAQAPAAAADYAPATAMIVRLDSIRGAEGLLARLVPSDTVAGFWRVDGDTARVQLRNGATFNIALRTRIRCP
jgi:hypothetical protein